MRAVRRAIQRQQHTPALRLPRISASLPAHPRANTTRVQTSPCWRWLFQAQPSSRCTRPSCATTQTRWQTRAVSVLKHQSRLAGYKQSSGISQRRYLHIFASCVVAPNMALKRTAQSAALVLR